MFDTMDVEFKKNDRISTPVAIVICVIILTFVLVIRQKLETVVLDSIKNKIDCKER